MNCHAIVNSRGFICATSFVIGYEKLIYCISGFLIDNALVRHILDVCLSVCHDSRPGGKWNNRKFRERIEHFLKIFLNILSKFYLE